MAKLTVIGLGPGAYEHLSLESLALLRSGATVILRTAVHPLVPRLQAEGLGFTSCDDLYQAGASFPEVYAAVCRRLLQAAAQGDVVYAVPGSPLVAEETVRLLRQLAPAAGVELDVRPAMSFLDVAYTALGLDPCAGLYIADAQAPEALARAGSCPLLLTQLYSRLVASDCKLALMEALPDEAEVYYLYHLGLPEAACRRLQLYQLDRQQDIDHLTSLYVPVQAQAAPRAKADIGPLVEVMAALRAPNGCPWDREQTFASIRANLIEEAYEYIEAVDQQDAAHMEEELGDVLMQVVFHAQMAQEEGLFDLQGVIDKITEKLIRRHPHVFGTTQVADSQEVLVNWEAIKQEEKQERHSVLDGVAQGLPALLRAYKVQGKAAKVGFDWQAKEPVWAKVEEEAQELRQALEQGGPEAEGELGDLFFALVNYARHCHIEPETALNGTVDRFCRRFKHVEERVQASGRPWSSYSLADLDLFWEEAKAQGL